MEHYNPLSFDRPLRCYECYICYLILPLHCLHILRNNHLLYKCSYGKMNLKLITIAKIDQLHTDAMGICRLICGGSFFLGGFSHYAHWATGTKREGLIVKLDSPSDVHRACRSCRLHVCTKPLIALQSDP